MKQYCPDCETRNLCWSFMSKKERKRNGQPVVGCDQDKYIYADDVNAETLKRLEMWAVCEMSKREKK